MYLFSLYYFLRSFPSASNLPTPFIIIISNISPASSQPPFGSEPSRNRWASEKRKATHRPDSVQSILKRDRERSNLVEALVVGRRARYVIRRWRPDDCLWEAGRGSDNRDARHQGKLSARARVSFNEREKRELIPRTFHFQTVLP